MVKSVGLQQLQETIKIEQCVLFVSCTGTNSITPLTYGHKVFALVLT